MMTYGELRRRVLAKLAPDAGPGRRLSRLSTASQASSSIGWSRGREASLDDKTVAELCRALGAVIPAHYELELVFLEHGVPYDQFGGGIRPRVNGLVMLLRSREDGHARLTQLIEYVLRLRGAGWAPADRLLHALRLDGCEWRDGMLIPTTSEPLPLAQEPNRVIILFPSVRTEASPIDSP